MHMEGYISHVQLCRFSTTDLSSKIFEIFRACDTTILTVWLPVLVQALSHYLRYLHIYTLQYTRKHRYYDIVQCIIYIYQSYDVYVCERDRETVPYA